MANVLSARKACNVNPLKVSAPLGAALAYLGVEGTVPLFHGAQGCTSFALVLLVKHFRESIPMQTTAMNEITTILGGREHLEQAIAVLTERMKPRLIGIASTALVETRGEDIAGDLRQLLARPRPEGAPAVVFAQTPDWIGGLEDGWARATSAVIEALVPRGRARGHGPARVNVLPGAHLTAADIDELRETITAFGLEPIFLPDISGSLDGHVPEKWIGTSLGGTPLADLERMGEAVHTIAVGEHMRAPANLLAARTGVPATVFPTLTGLEPVDRLVVLLGRLAGRAAPAALRRRRSQLVDALLDGHLVVSGRPVAIAADPDLLAALVGLVTSVGGDVVAAIASTEAPGLAGLPCPEVRVGDLEDFESFARSGGAELLIAGSHAEPIAARLGVPLLRAGFPVTDRLGVSHRASVGYRGTRELLFEVANQLLAARSHHAAGHAQGEWAP